MPQEPFAVEQTQENNSTASQPQAGDATVSGRKRQLPPSSLPRVPRPRTEVGPLHTAPATVPRTHAALQQQAQRIQALDAALRTFQMEGASLSVQERQAIVDAATHLPPRPYPDGVTEAALQQQQLHAVLTSRQPALPPKKSVKRKFLEGLKPYAEGKSLAICESESDLASFYNYFTAAGGLNKDGQRLYDNQLSSAEQEEVNKAIEQRKLVLPPKEPVKKKFLEGLKPYAEGKSIAICESESRLAGFHHYFTTAGGLNKDGQRLYDNQLSPAEQEEVNKAIEQRKKLTLISQRLLDITAAFTDPLLSLEGVAQKTKVDIAALRLILTESGLTELGKEALSKQNKSTQRAIECNLSLREKKRAERFGQAGTSAPQEPFAVEQPQENNSTASQPPTPVASTPDGLREFGSDLFGTPYPNLGIDYAEAPLAFDFDLSTPPPPEVEVSGGFGQAHTAREIVDADSHPSPQRATVSAAQRLANDPWLWDSDLVNFTRAIDQELHGQPRADLLHFVDPQQVRLLVEGDQVLQNEVLRHLVSPQEFRLLVEGDQQLRNEVLHRYASPQQVKLLAAGDQRLRNNVLRHLVGPNTPPILFLPVNNNNRHWSLLVVNQVTKQAFHYDSMVLPEIAHLATGTPQFRLASQVANFLGVEAPVGMPIAEQPDGNSCGDHVLKGIEILARRVVSGAVFEDGGMDLSLIRPKRDQIVAVVTKGEQLNAGIRAATPPQQP